MRQWTILLLIIVLAGCEREEYISPYEYTSYVEAEWDKTEAKIRSIARDESLSKMEICEQLAVEISRFRTDVSKVLNIKSAYDVRIYKSNPTPEDFARQKAIKLYFKYSDALQEFYRWRIAC